MIPCRWRWKAHKACWGHYCINDVIHTSTVYAESVIISYKFIFLHTKVCVTKMFVSLSAFNPYMQKLHYTKAQQNTCLNIRYLFLNRDKWGFSRNSDTLISLQNKFSLRQSKCLHKTWPYEAHITRKGACNIGRGGGAEINPSETLIHFMQLWNMPTSLTAHAQKHNFYWNSSMAYTTWRFSATFRRAL